MVTSVVATPSEGGALARLKNMNAGIMKSFLVFFLIHKLFSTLAALLRECPPQSCDQRLQLTCRERGSWPRGSCAGNRPAGVPPLQSCRKDGIIGFKLDTAHWEGMLGDFSVEKESTDLKVLTK